MKLVFDQSALRQMKALRKADRGLYREILDMLVAFAETDAAAGPEVKGLNNRAGQLRLRFGTWRALVAVSEDTVIVLRVAHRSEVYKW